MRVVIHAGMHKTGSSAIQDGLSRHEADDFHYLDWYSSNHCELFVYLFEAEADARTYHAIRARGPDFAARIPGIRAEWLARTAAQLDRCQGKTVLFSAEDISHPVMARALPAMKDFFSRWTDDIRVLAYVRSPMSFAQSAFQQMLKDGGARKFDPVLLWPRYRERFEPLDRVFGPENVTLRSYNAVAAAGLDIVQDFAAMAGIRGPVQPGGRVNETLSAEAIALLYLQRRFGEGFVSGTLQAVAGNETFIATLASLPGRKLAFAPELWTGLPIDAAADVAWIEARMQTALRDPPQREACVIRSEQDLVTLAMAAADSVGALLHRRLETMPHPPVEKLARTLDLLRKSCY